MASVDRDDVHKIRKALFDLYEIGFDEFFVYCNRPDSEFFRKHFPEYTISKREGDWDFFVGRECVVARNKRLHNVWVQYSNCFNDVQRAFYGASEYAKKIRCDLDKQFRDNAKRLLDGKRGRI